MQGAEEGEGRVHPILEMPKPPSAQPGDGGRQCTALVSWFLFLWPWTVSASPQQTEFNCKLVQEMYVNKETLISSCLGWCTGSWEGFLTSQTV